MGGIRKFSVRWRGLFPSLAMAPTLQKSCTARSKLSLSGRLSNSCNLPWGTLWEVWPCRFRYLRCNSGKVVRKSLSFALLASDLPPENCTSVKESSPRV